MNTSRTALLVVTLGIVGFAGPAGAQGAAGVVHVPADKMAPLLLKGGAVARTAHATVSIIRRSAPGESEVHDKETDTFYVLEGEATFVTGGTLIGGKTTAPGQIRGTGIDGGQTVTLAKGDVIVVPAGIPHWFKDVRGPFVYYTVKALLP